MHAGFGAFLTPPLARKITSLLLHKLMFYARIWATPPPPYAACILNQWPLTLSIREPSLAKNHDTSYPRPGDPLS